MLHPGIADKRENNHGHRSFHKNMNLKYLLPWYPDFACLRERCVCHSTSENVVAPMITLAGRMGSPDLPLWCFELSLCVLGAKRLIVDCRVSLN